MEQQTNKTYLIIGGTGGIGQAMLRQLASRQNDDEKKTNEQGTDSATLIATYHKRPPPDMPQVTWVKMDLTDEDSIKNAVETIKTKTTHIDWVINCIGLLHDGNQQPEKSLRQLSPEFFVQNMQVNALASLLLAKHIRPLLQKATRTEDAPAIFAVLSARVGSISDNQLGGWYSYRMSKAALNMGMKNVSIEWARSLPNTCVVVMQPGTVDTTLSEPFQGNVAEDKLFSPDYSAEQLLSVLATMRATDSGSFVDWAGEKIAW